MEEDPTSPGHNVPVFSVTELSAALKRVVEGEFGHVRLRGEVSGFKRAASGHLYMTLKDTDAVIDAVCWRGTAARLAIAPEDGLEVIATGRLTTYAGRSKYQIVIESLELAGEGALLKLLEERRKKLAAEGLFDADRKRPLPFLPEVVGVVTSPTGSVIRDILHRLADRFPRHVLVWPVLVQGEGAAEQIARAIDGFNALDAEDAVPRPDVLIVARGGGSLEDLWAFNEEAVVRAAAGSEIPLISAVGHETDTTLIDFASDLRAPTPTGAAEMAVPVRADLIATVKDEVRQLDGAINRYLQNHRITLEGLERGLPRPQRILEDLAQRLDDRSERLGLAARSLLANRARDLSQAAGGLRRRALSEAIERGGDRVKELGVRMPASVERLVGRASDRLSGQAALLDSFSYERVLDRGFVLVRDGKGNPLTKSADATPGLDISLQFGDGSADARIAGGGGAPKRRAAKKSSDADQDSLF